MDMESSLFTSATVLLSNRCYSSCGRRQSDTYLLLFYFFAFSALQEGCNTFLKITDNWPRQIFDGHYVSDSRENTLLTREHAFHLRRPLRLRFHVISDASVEDLVPHTPGEFLLTCNLNSYASLCIFCCFLFCRGGDQLALIFWVKALFKYFKNITESQPWPGLQCGTHIQVASSK